MLSTLLSPRLQPNLTDLTTKSIKNSYPEDLDFSSDEDDIENGSHSNISIKAKRTHPTYKKRVKHTNKISAKSFLKSASQMLFPIQHKADRTQEKNKDLELVLKKKGKKSQECIRPPPVPKKEENLLNVSSNDAKRAISLALLIELELKFQIEFDEFSKNILIPCRTIKMPDMDLFHLLFDTLYTLCELHRTLLISLKQFPIETPTDDINLLLIITESIHSMEPTYRAYCHHFIKGYKMLNKLKDTRKELRQESLDIFMFRPLEILIGYKLVLKGAKHKIKNLRMGDKVDGSLDYLEGLYAQSRTEISTYEQVYRIERELKTIDHTIVLTNKYRRVLIRSGLEVLDIKWKDSKMEEEFNAIPIKRIHGILFSDMIVLVICSSIHVNQPIKILCKCDKLQNTSIIPLRARAGDPFGASMLVTIKNQVTLKVMTRSPELKFDWLRCLESIKQGNLHSLTSTPKLDPLKPLPDIEDNHMNQLATSHDNENRENIKSGLKISTLEALSNMYSVEKKDIVGVEDSVLNEVISLKRNSLQRNISSADFELEVEPVPAHNQLVRNSSISQNSAPSRSSVESGLYLEGIHNKLPSLPSTSNSSQSSSSIPSFVASRASSKLSLESSSSNRSSIVVSGHQPTYTGNGGTRSTSSLNTNQSKKQGVSKYLSKPCHLLVQDGNSETWAPLGSVILDLRQFQDVAGCLFIVSCKSQRTLARVVMTTVPNLVIGKCTDTDIDLVLQSKTKYRIILNDPDDADDLLSVLLKEQANFYQIKALMGPSPILESPSVEGLEGNAILNVTNKSYQPGPFESYQFSTPQQGGTTNDKQNLYEPSLDHEPSPTCLASLTCKLFTLRTQDHSWLRIGKSHLELFDDPTLTKNALKTQNSTGNMGSNRISNPAKLKLVIRSMTNYENVLVSLAPLSFRVEKLASTKLIIYYLDRYHKSSTYLIQLKSKKVTESLAQWLISKPST